MGGNSKCFVPDCNTGYRSDRKRCKAEGKRVLSMFRGPDNPVLMHIWRQVIPRSDKVLTKKDAVCEYHFAKEDIEWDFSHDKLPDGKRLLIRRGRPSLKPGAIPTNFQNLPKYSSNLRKLVSQLPKHELAMRKPSKIMCAIKKELHHYYLRAPQSKDAKNVSGIEKNLITYERKKKNEKSNQDLVSNGVNETLEETTGNGEESSDMSEDIVNTSALDSNINSSEINSEEMTVKSENSEMVAEEDIHISTNNTNDAVVGEVTYDVLVSNLELIPKPNSSWGITAHDGFIICAQWNKEYMPEKRVIIDCNLNIKVYVKDKEIASYKNWVFSSLSDVTHIMHLIDS